MLRLFLLIPIILLSACSSQPEMVPYPKKFSGQGENEIYVVSHGWHTGFVLSAEKIQNQLPELKNRFGEIAYLELGWGDQGFYQAKEITADITLNAIFWPSPSVIHAVAVPNDIDTYFNQSRIEKLCLTEQEVSSLITFLAGSFAQNQSGNIIPLQKGIYGDSQFYQGSGEYHLMNTCNKWTAKGLKSIGMDIEPTFKLTADSIITYLSKSGKSLHEPPLLCPPIHPIQLP